MEKTQWRNYWPRRPRNGAYGMGAQNYGINYLFTVNVTYVDVHCHE